MDAGEGVHNLSRERARAFTMEMIEKCNAKLRQNSKMHLPLRNNTPVLPVPWYYVLAPDPAIPGHEGIYFDHDTALYFYRHGKNSNRTSRDVVNKYGVNTDSVINIFMMPHHPDSVGRPDYRAVGTGIVLGSSLKIAQVFTPDLIPESCVGLLNHEIGHGLGLSHTWGGNDGCEDTPNHTNCWYYTDTPPCDSLVSNNLMDYNAWQVSVTPCQIGRVGDVVIADGGVLQLSCRLSLATGARIIVSPAGRLILDDCHLHNACGDQWEGIEILRRGKSFGIVEVLGNPQIENVVHAVELNSTK
jgi:hypothetical protein